MSAKTPQSSKVAFKIIRDIIDQGVVNMPAQFQGSGAPGETLEYLCNVDRNNNDSPDLADWEVKFHGGNALLTLLHKTPEPKGIMNELVDEFGWDTKSGKVSFRHTIKGLSPRGFFVVNEDNKIIIQNTNNPNIAPYWTHNTLLGAIGAKLRRLILVHGKVYRKDKKVIYNSAVAYWGLDLLGICEAIKAGIIYIDFDVRTKGSRGTALRDHGTKLRIHIRDIGIIYENSQVIV